MDPRSRGRDPADGARARHRLRPLQPARPRLPHRPDPPPRTCREDDFRRDNPRFEGENFQRNLELVERVEEIAAEKEVTPGQLALAWVLAQGEDVVPIPGTKRVRYLEENVAAAEMELSEEDLQRIDEAAPRGSAAGDRYADMSPVDR